MVTHPANQPFWRIFGSVFSIVFVLAITGCAVQEETDPQPAAGTELDELVITSPAFEPGQAIPSRYTCQGEDISPPLVWSLPPSNTESLVLIMDDPDAPGGTWVHWVLHNIPPATEGLPAGEDEASLLPEGTVAGSNSWRHTGYGGPCPPSGEHRYFFHIYALDTRLEAEALDKAGLLAAMDGHILAQGEMFGTYQK